MSPQELVERPAETAADDQTRTGTETQPGPEPGSGEQGDLSPARLRIALGRLSRRLRPTAAAGSLTTSEVDVLMAAERRGPIRLSDLASFVGLNPTMLSRLIPKLEQAGLITRIFDESDRRVCRVQATPSGSTLLSSIRSERNDALSRRIAELRPSERRVLSVALPVLEQLAERLGSSGPNGTEAS